MKKMKCLFWPILMVLLATTGCGWGTDTGSVAPGTALEADADGLIRASVMTGPVADLKTIGVKVEIEGARIVEWLRNESFLEATGGQVILLESKVVDGGLSLIAGTTTPVSYDEEQVLLTLTLEPTSDAPALRVVTEGNNYGLIDASGQRMAAPSFRVTSGGIEQ